jgi:ferredoxin--NADP+ reductase
MASTIAIVGSGPAGFYAAEALVKDRPDIHVDLFERLPTPYGLVRSGVAPDHQGTKNVWRVFHRTAQRPQVRFLGNVEVGRDVSLAELREIYDAVVLAFGATVDRELGIPGEHLRGVIGSGPFTGWYNGHPDWAGLDPDLDTSHVAVIGHGNVAVDVARVLARSPSEMVKTDLPGYARTRLARAPITDIYMIGRRGPAEASFTPVELRELGELERAVVLVDPAQLPETVHAPDPKDQKLKEKILEILRGYARNDPASKPVRLHILFYAAPHEILGRDGKVHGLRLMRTRVEHGRAVPTGDTFDLPVGWIVKAIGYYCRPIEGLTVPIGPRASCLPNQDGHVEGNVWVVGWAKRGPSGVIATNRADSMAVAERLVKSLPAQGKAGAREAIDALLQARGVQVVSFPDWEKIDRVECERATDGAPRVKITDWQELLAVARSTPLAAP